MRATGLSTEDIADRLGVNRSTVHRVLNEAARRGYIALKPVLPGFEIVQVTNTPKGDFVKQRPEKGPEFAVPANHQVKGVSALVDGDGRTIQQWIKTKSDDQPVAEEAIRAAFESYAGRAEPIAPPHHP